jgi:hypothetical protein
MLAITCEKCRRRYTATDEELRVYLQEAEGKKHAQVLCPHCGKPNKIAVDRIASGLRFSQPAAETPATPTDAAPQEAAPESAPSQEGASKGGASNPAA